MDTSTRGGGTRKVFGKSPGYAVGPAVAVCLSAVCFSATRAQGAIVSGAGSGDITFHSTFYADGVIAPSHTTGPSVIPQWGSKLAHEVFAPLGTEHSYMSMTWDFTSSTPKAFVPGTVPSPTTTRLELIPSPPVGAHHAATMKGSFEILYTLDAGGLAPTVIPAQIYQVFSYVSPLLGSPAAASFEASWDYTDVGFGPLGSQFIHYDAPAGLGVVADVASLPLGITIPAGHPTLKVSGYFLLSADSDDFMGGSPPFDTLIGIVPEPASLGLATCGAVALAAAGLRRRIGRRWYGRRRRRQVWSRG